MFDTYIQRPGAEFAAMRLMFITTVLLLLASLICGCGALRSPDGDTVSLCKRGFANNHDWKRASRFSRDARKLRRKFGSIQFQPSADGKPIHSTLWFRDARHRGFASCSRDSCEVDRCLWLVRLYENRDGDWALASDYHLGVPSKK
jgi:hypothetical protein